MVRKLLFTAAAIVFLNFPALAEEPPLPPTYSGVYQPMGVDEIGLWRRDDELERSLASSPMVVRDDDLTQYVRSVLCKTVGENRCSAVRIYLVREPMFNASMTPNGTMRVFSGLLLRTRNEAELGAILGHEFGHFEMRHTLSEFKERRTGTDILAWASVLAAMAPGRDVRQSYRDLEVAVYGDIYRFGRNQEREADFLRISYLNQSDLRPQAASSVWLNVIGEAEASASVRGLKKPNFTAIAFAASHPPNAERAAYLSMLADPQGYTRDDGASRYREMLAPWLPMFLDDQVKLNDFGATEYIIGNLAENGWTAPLLFARGELYRARGAQRDLVNAIDFYNGAIKQDPEHAGAYRGLGLSLIKTGRTSEGQAALAKFLEIKPHASDAKMIKLMLPTGAKANE